MRQISAGHYHACGLAEDGRATCWGAGLSNAPSGQFIAIDSGTDQTCGLRDNGSAVCWGPIAGYWGDSEYSKGVLTEISAGSYVCGLRDDQAIYCFPQHFGPSVPPEIEKFLNVETAGYHVCGLKENGSLVCWGWSHYEYDGPALDDRHFIDFTLGAFQAQAIVCGLLKTRHAICWHNADGGEDYSPVTFLPEDQQYSAISASDEHVCAILLDQSLICAPGAPFDPSPAPAEGQFMDVSVGDGFACALNLDGSPVCWGNPGYGRTSPPGGERFKSISSGRTHACGLREDGTVACWGWNDLGQTKPPE
ncbi:MAG: RCC1 domain-containing protein [Chloroflexota bacterium]|nr:RCC1 domain-containing protein [Chloroflexota bacterium]